MQTWITDTDIAVSANNLDRQRLCAQLYEGIHILASLFGVSDKLVNPKHDVSNHPAAKLWRGYESSLWWYVHLHICEWENRGYETPTNSKNLTILARCLSRLHGEFDFITPDLITTHRSVLIAKNPAHYGPLWPDCPRGLQMRYDWREK